MIILGYDAWRLRGPAEPPEIGTDKGDVCRRIHEPDEDAPRGYRPKPCRGVMTESAGVMICDTCWEIAG